MATEIPEIGEKVTHWRRPTPASCALVMAPVPTDRQLKIAEMLNLAKECGFACEALTTYHSELASKIASHLVHRLGKSVYQSVDFSMTLFSRQAALDIFGETNSMLTNTATQLHWKFQAVDECAYVLKPLLATLPSSSCVEGMSRALLSESEPTALVCATVMPTLEAKWTLLPNGAGQLKINFFYVLSDVDGEMHAPKDENRIELELGHGLEQQLRRRVLLDVGKMIGRGFPMATRWFVQLGMETTAMALVVFAAETAGRRPKRKELLLTEKKAKCKKNHHVIETILEERASTGKAKAYFLVEWAGYHPTWEAWRIMGRVGDPIATWETLAVVKNTEALTAWREPMGVGVGIQ
jgi:hypothetical protein